MTRLVVVGSLFLGSQPEGCHRSAKRNASCDAAQRVIPRLRLLSSLKPLRGAAFPKRPCGQPFIELVFVCLGTGSLRERGELAPSMQLEIWPLAVVSHRELVSIGRA